jgi:sigma-B regulation protein RsbU (phosphoserine phosphatase)
VGVRAEQTVEGARRLELSQFMTDGSLSGVCASLSQLTGLEIELRDERGRRVVRRTESTGDRQSGDATWAVEDVPRPVPLAGEVPIVVSGQTIGSLCVGGPNEPRLGSSPTADVLKALSQISRSAAEYCESTLAQRRALDELGVLFELTSMLVDAADEGAVLEKALGSALRILSMDAGSVVLLPEDSEGRLSEDERDLVLRAAVGLSQTWLKSPEALSHGRVFDRRAMAGEIVMSEDLRKDPEVRIPQMVIDEGVVSFACIGLSVRGSPIGVLRLYGRSPRTFSDTERRLLRSIGQQSAASVHLARSLRLRSKEREYDRQLRIAAEIQQRMLPRGLPQFETIDIAGRYQPSFEVGGDFYDLFEIAPSGRRRLGMVVGDVVGKGVPAAMLMASVRTSLRAHAESVSTVEEVMERVNRDMCRDTRVSEFATVWYGTIDPVTRTLRYCSAGHPPTFVVRTDHSIEELGQGGLVVGVDPHAPYICASVQLEPGDTLVAFTDGIDEAPNFAGKQFGRAGIHRAVLEALQRDPHSSAFEVLEHLFWTLRQYAGLQTRPDDATAVVIRVKR